MFRQTFTFVTEIFIKKRGFFWIFWTENDQISQKYVQKQDKYRKESVDIWNKKHLNISANPLTFDPELSIEFKKVII